VVYRAVSEVYCTGLPDIRRWLEDSKRPVKILKFNHSSDFEGNIQIHTLSVRLFAGARELMNQDHIEVVLTLPANVRDLKRAITEQHESLVSFVSFGRIAINNDFASEDTVIPLEQNGLMVLALIPPVSGG
jgi:molybdopterin converting factor small subunit